MEHGVDDDLRPADLEEHGVRESPKECPSHRAVDKLVSFRLASDRRETGALLSAFELGPYVLPGLRR
jgi:hypothetical protein